MIKFHSKPQKLIPPKVHNKATNYIKTFPVYNPIPKPHFPNFEKRKSNKTDWFVAGSSSANIGCDYEANALKNHKYYVKVKSLHLLRKARELLGDLSGLITIDFGCGTAETTEYFQYKFSHIFCCDNSRGMLEYASRKMLRNVTFKLCQSEELPFGDETVDIVLMFGVIHHIDTKEKLLRIFEGLS